MTREVAERVNQLFLECAERLDEMTALVRQHYPPNEVSLALEDMALTSGHLLMVMKAVYEEHRDLMPPQLRSEQRDQSD